jgi:hypothetical protein
VRRRIPIGVFKTRGKKRGNGGKNGVMCKIKQNLFL